jgi:hypothetical protein
MLLVTTIQAHVWEGESIFDQILQLYASIFFGLATLGMVIRDYRLVNYGIDYGASRQLTEAQIEPIRRALEDRDLRAAIKRYRETVPDAGRSEANHYVIRLWESLRAQYPERFAPPSLSLSSLNWRAMAICTIIAAIIFGAMWAMMPPADPTAFASKFVYSFLFGAGLMAGGRVKGFGNRMLLLVPAVAATLLSEAIVPRAAGASSHSTGPFLCGFFFGSFLMVSGFTPRRKRSVSKP